MASASFQSSDMELWGEPEITKPEPLRIVKERAKTFTGRSTSREVAVSRRGCSRSTDASGSPPEDPNKPLTIHKMRRARGSILDGSFGQSPSESSILSMTMQPALPQEDQNTTPKARQAYGRTVSVGSFLKSELFGWSSEAESEIAIPPLPPIWQYPGSLKETFNPLDSNLFPRFTPDDLDIAPNQLSKDPQITKSKGKKLMLKALDSVGSGRSKSMHFPRSKPSKDSLLSRRSVGNRRASLQVSSETACLNSSRFSFEPGSVDITDLGINSRICSDAILAAPTSSFILYPEITVVPEVDSVDTGDGHSIWVAILVTGVLQRIMGNTSNPNPVLKLNHSSLTQAIDTSDNTDYGYLYGVDIKLVARSGCFLETIVAELSDSKTLQSGQTELLLAKVAFSAATKNPTHVRESSMALIDELESRLGNKVTDYMAVGVSYRHSALPTYRNSAAAPMGMSYYSTTTKTEAHAVIKRHCPNSSWSQRVPGNSRADQVSSPLIPLIKAYYDPGKAEDIIRIITVASEPVTDIHRRRLGSDHSYNTSSETIVPGSKDTCKSLHVQPTQFENTFPVTSPQQSLDITLASDPDTNTDTDPEPLTPKPSSELDPARKIWSEMRRSSRAATRRALQMTNSWSNGSEVGIDGDTESEREIHIQKTQARIQEIALRNKRSVGADTLRSMAAPSAQTGLSLGRSWGWGPPWW